MSAVGSQQIPREIWKFDSLLASLRQCRNHGMIRIGGSNLARSTWGANRLEEDGVYFTVLLPLTRDVVFIIDRLHRTDRLTGAAIDTFIGLDVEHPSALVNAVHRTLFDTGLILYIHTRLGDYVGHNNPFK